MAERLDAASRQISMRKSVLGMVLVGPLVLTGCGDDGSDRAGVRPSDTTSSSAIWCRGEDAPVRLIRADLDGDGTMEDVDFIPPSDDCAGSLSSSVGGLEETPTLDWTARPRPA